MSLDELMVLQVSTSAIGGGAERVAMSLHEEYLARGIDSWLAVGAGEGTPGTLLIPNDARRTAWARTLLPSAARLNVGAPPRRSPRGLANRALRIAAEPGRFVRVFFGHEDFDFPGTAALLRELVADADVLHLHNLHGYYFDLRELPRLSNAVPTILTMHDAWLLTGHCAHPFDCQRWKTGCGECPYPGTYPPMARDASADNWLAKRELLKRSQLHLAVPSHWLMDMVEQSGLLGESADARVVPNGIDTRLFRPGDKAEARASLGLPQGKEIILFAANALRDNPYKDFQSLMGALPIVARARGERLQLVALGGISEGAHLPGVEILALPFESDPARVAEYFRAADLYIHPSRADNLPLAVMEAMACGTPVVASRVGGIPEIVEDGVTGTLVDVGAVDEMANAIITLLEDEPRRRAFAEAGVARVGERFSFERQVDAYLDWYVELLGR
jgi:glycosyltransferase involved in cell wall biosynthesis